MILDDLMNTRTTIKDVVPDPSGGEGLDVSYNPEALTPDVLAAVRAIPDDTPDEVAIRDLLSLWEMEWNMRTYRDPKEAEPSAEIKLPNGRTKVVAADLSGKPLLIDVPSTVDGMKGVSFRVIRTVYDAIVKDARPKATTNSDDSSTS